MSEAGSIEFVSVAVPDVHGVLRGKTLTATEFDRVRERGVIALPELVHGLDPDDLAVVAASESPDAPAFGDLRVRFDPDAMIPLPWCPGWRLALASPEWLDGGACPLGSRVVAAAAIDAAAELGYEIRAAFEYEVRLRRRDDGRPAFRAHQFRLGELEQSAELLRALSECCDAMGLALGAVHAEGGAGLLELITAPADGIASADNALLLKHAVKGVAHQHGLDATFMAKPVVGEEGSSGHLHVSVWHSGRNALCGPPDDGVPAPMAHAIGGLLQYMPALSAVYNPTLNSYKRFVREQFAPLAASWGVDDRTAAVRAIVDGGSAAARVEVRRPGADANPHLVLAAAVHSILAGLDAARSPSAASGSVSTAPTLPLSLEAALRVFESEPAVERWLGRPFAHFYAATRQRELDAWRHCVSDWERERYGHFV